MIRRASIVGVFAFLGCNSLLGIDEPLEFPVAAGGGGAAASSTITTAQSSTSTASSSASAGGASMSTTSTSTTSGSGGAGGTAAGSGGEGGAGGTPITGICHTGSCVVDTLLPTQTFMGADGDITFCPSGGDLKSLTCTLEIDLRETASPIKLGTSSGAGGGGGSGGAAGIPAAGTIQVRVRSLPFSFTLSGQTTPSEAVLSQGGMCPPGTAGGSPFDIDVTATVTIGSNDPGTLILGCGVGVQVSSVSIAALSPQVCCNTTSALCSVFTPPYSTYMTTTTATYLTNALTAALSKAIAQHECLK